ncbi:hypothetical protein TNCV_4047711 [Trichonephila clavipes]|nr:hypothetical protein TNCV_4047711 [Trichonephila clavipes]
MVTHTVTVSLAFMGCCATEFEFMDPHKVIGAVRTDQELLEVSAWYNTVLNTVRRNPCTCVRATTVAVRKSLSSLNIFLCPTRKLTPIPSSKRTTTAHGISLSNNNFR